MFLFALPAGALADIIDKRRFILILEILISLVSAAFATLVSTGVVTPAALLLFMFLINAFSAWEAPAWQSSGWEVDRSSIGKAVAAAITGRPSDRLFEQFSAGSPRLPSWNNVVSPRGQRGGLPVIEAGIVQGGCGVSGAPTPAQDEECTTAGIEALAVPEPISATYPDRSSPSLSMASSA
jgi:hypothetical protein